MIDQDPITNIHDAIEAAASAAQKFQSEVWWRGHSKDKWVEKGVPKEWKLVPGVYRRENEDPSIYEKSISVRFMSRAPSRHEKVPEVGQWDRWLVLMQHYGLPTRLLDWTESVLKAIYFAVREHPDQNAVLWAMSPITLNQIQIGDKVIAMPGNHEVAPLFCPPFIEGAKQQERIVAFFPRELDTRMLVQQTLFTVHGSSLPIEGLEQHERFLMKWTIPSGAKENIDIELERLGIIGSALFPDLEHLAKDIASMNFLLPESDELPIEQ